MLGRSWNYGGWCSGAAGGMMDVVDEGKRFYHFFYGLGNGIILKVLKKVKQWASAAEELPLAPGQSFFYHTALHLGPGFESVTSRFRCLPWDVQGEKFVICPATNNCVTWDKSLELPPLLYL